MPAQRPRLGDNKNHVPILLKEGSRTGYAGFEVLQVFKNPEWIKNTTYAEMQNPRNDLDLVIDVHTTPSFPNCTQTLPDMAADESNMTKYHLY